MADTITEIKKLVKEDQLVIGKDLTLKGIRAGTLSKVYMAKNCPADLKEDIEHFSEIAGVEVEELNIDNVELGDICKRPFYIAVMGVKK